MEKKISTNELNANDKFLIKGTLEFGRLASQVEGTELENVKKRAMEQGSRIIPTKPYTEAIISNPVVMVKDPSQPTLIEEYAKQKIYVSKKHPEKGPQFAQKNIGKFLPNIYAINNEGKYEKVTLKRELAKGLNVTLVCRVYKALPNNGITLDSVYINEPIKYFEPTNSLAEYGLIVEDTTTTTNDQNTEENNELGFGEQPFDESFFDATDNPYSDAF